MKKLVKRLIINKFNAKFFLKPLLNIDRYLYFLIGQYSSLYYDGKHPKHDILKYQEWFCNNLDSSWNVIDVGSNTGTMAEKMSKKVKKVYGIEINENLHQKAQKNKSSNLAFICADATKFDYNTIEKIDCVTLSNVLEHIEHRVIFLNSLKQNIQWGGQPHFLIRVPMLDRHWVVILKKNLGVEYRLDPTHFIEYTKESFYKEMEACDLHIDSFEVRWGEIYATVRTN